MKTEADMRALKYQDKRIISDMTLSTLIDKYSKEIGKAKPFGRNKAAILNSLKIALGDVSLPNLTADRLIEHTRNRMAQHTIKFAPAPSLPTWKEGKYVVADVRDVGNYVDSCRTGALERFATDQ